MRERDKRSESGSETDAASSSSSPCSSSSSSSEDLALESNNVRKHGTSKRKRSISTSRVKDDTEPSSSSSGSSDADTKRRKSRSTRGKERRSGSHRRGKSDREKEKKRDRRKRSSKGGSDEKHGRKEKYSRKDKHDRERRKRKVMDVDYVSPAPKDEDVLAVQFGAKNPLQAVNEAQLQQKELVRRNVEIAKARLASGELQRMKHEQMEMQRLYGTVDWREKKKLRAEKSRLERTIAAGKKLASIEERENARMDAFRVADCQQPKHSVRQSGEQKQHEHLPRQKLSIKIICHHLLVVEFPPGPGRLLGHGCLTKRNIFRHYYIPFTTCFPSPACPRQRMSLRSVCDLQLTLGKWLQIACECLHFHVSVLVSILLNFATHAA